MSTGNLEIQEHCTENDPLAPDLLSVGSCGLHVLHSGLTPDKIKHVAELQIRFFQLSGNFTSRSCRKHVENQLGSKSALDGGWNKSF